MSKHVHSYLALGDSYTIGEGVALHETFPYQLVQLLRSSGIPIHAPEIIAKTGWTTFELAEHILHTKLNPLYDFVTLLIGVNNQYRNLPVADYESEFEFLVKKALQFSGDKPDSVIVLSIPDWGATPFAHDRGREKIADEINQFNAVNKRIASGHRLDYVDITRGTREAVSDTSLVTTDQLHYSEKEYRRWAELVAEVIRARIYN